MTKIHERLSKEQLDEKQELILELSERLLEGLKSSKLFKGGMTNRQIVLDTLLGVGFFTASILDATKRCSGGNETVSNFYKEELLPTACDMYAEMSAEKEEEDKLKFS